MELLRVVVDIRNNAALCHRSRYQFFVRDVVCSLGHASLSRILVVIDVGRSLTRTLKVARTNTDAKSGMWRSHLV